MGKYNKLWDVESGLQFTLSHILLWVHVPCHSNSIYILDLIQVFLRIECANYTRGRFQISASTDASQLDACKALKRRNWKQSHKPSRNQIEIKS